MQPGVQVEITAVLVVGYENILSFYNARLLIEC